jgi:hypothetical protein
MTSFNVKDTKELEGNADQFISSIALAEDSKCNPKFKELIISKIKEVIIHSEIVIDELLNLS